MRAFGTTIMMAVIAAISCGIAFYYAPRIEVQSANVQPDDPLFEENYEADQVRSIEITQFDKGQNAVQKIRLAQVDGSWVVPDKSNFLAGNFKQIAAAVGSLRDRVILQVESDQQKDHEKYGVVEPGAEQGASTGTGTLIRLEDRNQQTIRDLIVGYPTRDESKRFVRIPGQPQIYVIEFDGELLDTKFSNWVDGDLLKILSGQIPVSAIDVQYYLVDPQTLGAKYTKKPMYRARVKTNESGQLVDVWMPDANQQLPQEPTFKDEPINQQTVANFVRQLAFFELQDVKRKPPAAAQHLATPKPEDSVSDFKPLIRDGFRHVGMEHQQHQFDCVSGEIRISFQDGAQFNIHFGNLAGVDISDRSKLNRFMMITGEVNESLVPMPEKPSSGENDQPEVEEKESDDASQSGAEAKAQQETDPNKPPAVQDDQFQYQQRISQRNEILKFARQRVNSVNQLHADWIYVISESSLRNLFPDLQTWMSDEHAGHDH